MRPLDPFKVTPKKPKNKFQPMLLSLLKSTICTEGTPFFFLYTHFSVSYSNLPLFPPQPSYSTQKISKTQVSHTKNHVHSYNSLRSTPNPLIIYIFVIHIKFSNSRGRGRHSGFLLVGLLSPYGLMWNLAESILIGCFCFVGPLVLVRIQFRTGACLLSMRFITI